MRRNGALNDQLYDKLKEAILTNQLEFNIVYSETKLAASYAVSRTPIREALVRLSQEHYIDILPSRGFMLHKPDEEDLNVARHFRLAIEPYCARIIVSDLTSRRRAMLIGEMEELLHEQGKNADIAHHKSFWQLDLQFHNRIVSYLNNPYFNDLFASSYYHFSSLAVEDFFPKNRHIATLKEHAAIIDTLKSGDADLAQAAVCRHIEESINAILQNAQAQKRCAQDAR